MADNNTPAWRTAFNKAERAVGEPLEKAIDTREFATLVTLTAKVRKTIQRQIYGTVNRSLHFVGLSTLKDTRDIARQLNRVQEQLRQVSMQLESLEERDGLPGEPAAPRQAPRKVPPRKSPPRKAPPRKAPPIKATPLKSPPVKSSPVTPPSAQNPAPTPDQPATSAPAPAQPDTKTEGD